MTGIHYLSKTLTILIMALVAIAALAPIASAGIPSVALSSSVNGSGHTILNISVSHIYPATSSHYVDKINLTVHNTSSGTNQYPSITVPVWSSQLLPFYVNYDLGTVTDALSISCKAECIIHGWSPVATLAVAPPGSHTKPSVPLNLEVTAGNGYIILTWDVPASNGGTTITGYNLYRGTADYLTLYHSLGNVTSYNDTGLSNDVTYYYKVAAVNSIGEGNQTVVTNATPQGAGGSTLDATTLAIIAIVLIAVIVIAIVVLRARKKPKTPEKNE